MNLLIKNVHLIDPLTKKDGITDILIINGIITKIADTISTDDAAINSIDTIKTIDANGCFCFPGLTDIHCHFRDPGWPEKETIESGCEAALAGGVTTVVCMANTKPVADNPDTLRYIFDKAKGSHVQLLQNSAMTIGLAGKELVDCDAMLEAGACGFSDDGIPIEDVNVMIHALKETKRLDAVLSLHEELPSLRFSAGVNFGEVAKKLDVLGAPNLSESALIERDIMLQKIHGGKLHFQHVSTAEAANLIRQAKKEGQTITAEVTPQHLYLTEDELLNVGSNAKLNPPLRTKKDVDALIEGVMDGTFDCIATDHAPHTKAEKESGIAKAPSGLIGLETSLSLCYVNLVVDHGMTMTKLIELMSVTPAAMYGIKKSVAEGCKADLTIFDPNKKWLVEENTLKSRSSNSPFIGKEMSGKVIYTICDDSIMDYTE